MGVARKLARSRVVVSALITAAVLATTAGVRSVGWLEELELVAFDWLLRSQPLIELEDNPVVLIKLRDEFGRCVLPECGMHKGPCLCSGTGHDENSFLVPERQRVLDELPRLHWRERCS